MDEPLRNTQGLDGYVLFHLGETGLALRLADVGGVFRYPDDRANDSSSGQVMDLYEALHLEKSSSSSERYAIALRGPESRAIVADGMPVFCAVNRFQRFRIPAILFERKPACLLDFLTDFREAFFLLELDRVDEG